MAYTTLRVLLLLLLSPLVATAQTTQPRVEASHMRYLGSEPQACTAPTGTIECTWTADRTSVTCTVRPPQE